MSSDSEDLAASWRKANKQDRADIRQIRMAPEAQQRLEGRLTEWNALGGVLSAGLFYAGLSQA